jgi:senescence-associated protein
MKSRMQRMKRTAARAARTTKKVAGKIAKRTRKVLKRVGKRARSRETRRQVARVLQGTGGVLETAGKAVVIMGAAAEVAAEELR